MANEPSFFSHTLPLSSLQSHKTRESPWAPPTRHRSHQLGDLRAVSSQPDKTIKSPATGNCCRRPDSRLH
ncbi:hypothetical protein E2C01_052835 [Portunus trituberculatus]|uniref:Uncharacterized protein n=1 Tax=Portunus trituberculatus TaxID=210409 RepID=A0A5B7GMW0_PORTR|nr:hypothetical protein [Portunus trituberculatus]